MHDQVFMMSISVSEHNNSHDDTLVSNGDVQPEKSYLCCADHLPSVSSSQGLTF